MPEKTYICDDCGWFAPIGNGPCEGCEQIIGQDEQLDTVQTVIRSRTLLYWSPARLQEILPDITCGRLDLEELVKQSLPVVWVHVCNTCGWESLNELGHCARCVQTQGSDTRIQGTLTRMLAGDLQEMPLNARRKIFSLLASSKDVEGLVQKSFQKSAGPQRPAESEESASTTPFEIGQKLGAQLVEEKGSTSEEAIKEIAAVEAIGLVGPQDSPPWHGSWHIINVVLFVTFFLFAIFQTSSTSEAAQIAEAVLWAWLISVFMMLWIRSNKSTRRRKREWQDAYQDGYSKTVDLVTRGILRGAGLEARTGSEHWSQVVQIRQPIHKDLWDPPPFEHTPPLAPHSTRQVPNQAGTPKLAEELCSQWMRSRGEKSSSVTQDGADGGVDIRSNNYVAQVKNYKGTVPVTAIRELHGVAVSEGKRALFFTSGRYTASAIEFADQVQMPIFCYLSSPTQFDGVNRFAREILQRGRL